MNPRSFSLILASFVTACSVHPVEIVAHRGASHDAPENTLASEKLAWEQNADAVETDIRLTKDGQLIVSHDKAVGRSANRSAAIADHTLAELRDIDAGAGERLSTLDEQIALIPAGKRLLVELKIGPEIVPELERCLARTGASKENITIISFDYEALKEVRKRLPRYPTLYLVGHDSSDEETPDAKEVRALEEVIAEAKAADLTGLDLEHTWSLDAAAVKKIKDAGLQLHVWTVNDVEIARHWIDLGVASITTDRPGWLREQLK